MECQKPSCKDDVAPYDAFCLKHSEQYVNSTRRRNEKSILKRVGKWLEDPCTEHRTALNLSSVKHGSCSRCLELLQRGKMIGEEVNNVR